MILESDNFRHTNLIKVLLLPIPIAPIVGNMSQERNIFLKYPSFNIDDHKLNWLSKLISFSQSADHGKKSHSKFSSSRPSTPTHSSNGSNWVTTTTATTRSSSSVSDTSSKISHPNLSFNKDDSKNIKDKFMDIFTQSSPTNSLPFAFPGDPNILSTLDEMALMEMQFLILDLHDFFVHLKMDLLIASKREITIIHNSLISYLKSLISLQHLYPILILRHAIGVTLQILIKKGFALSVMKDLLGKLILYLKDYGTTANANRIFVTSVLSHILNNRNQLLDASPSFESQMLEIYTSLTKCIRKYEKYHTEKNLIMSRLDHAEQLNLFFKIIQLFPYLTSKSNCLNGTIKMFKSYSLADHTISHFKLLFLKCIVTYLENIYYLFPLTETETLLRNWISISHYDLDILEGETISILCQNISKLLYYYTLILYHGSLKKDKMVMAEKNKSYKENIVLESITSLDMNLATIIHYIETSFKKLLHYNRKCMTKFISCISLTLVNYFLDFFDKVWLSNNFPSLVSLFLKIFSSSNSASDVDDLSVSLAILEKISTSLSHYEASSDKMINLILNQLSVLIDSNIQDELVIYLSLLKTSLKLKTVYSIQEKGHLIMGILLQYSKKPDNGLILSLIGDCFYELSFFIMLPSMRNSVATVYGLQIVELYFDLIQDGSTSSGNIIPISFLLNQSLSSFSNDMRSEWELDSFNNQRSWNLHHYFSLDTFKEIWSYSFSCLDQCFKNPMEGYHFVVLTAYLTILTGLMRLYKKWTFFHAKDILIYLEQLPMQISDPINLDFSLVNVRYGIEVVKALFLLWKFLKDQPNVALKNRLLSLILTCLDDIYKQILDDRIHTNIGEIIYNEYITFVFSLAESIMTHPENEDLVHLQSIKSIIQRLILKFTTEILLHRCLSVIPTLELLNAAYVYTPTKNYTSHIQAAVTPQSTTSKSQIKLACVSANILAASYLLPFPDIPTLLLRLLMELWLTNKNDNVRIFLVMTLLILQKQIVNSLKKRDISSSFEFSQSSPIFVFVSILQQQISLISAHFLLETIFLDLLSGLFDILIAFNEILGVEILNSAMMILITKIREFTKLPTSKMCEAHFSPLHICVGHLKILFILLKRFPVYVGSSNGITPFYNITAELLQTIVSSIGFVQAPFVHKSLIQILEYSLKILSLFVPYIKFSNSSLEPHRVVLLELLLILDQSFDGVDECSTDNKEDYQLKLIFSAIQNLVGKRPLTLGIRERDSQTCYYLPDSIPREGQVVSMALPSNGISISPPSNMIDLTGDILSYLSLKTAADTGSLDLMVEASSLLDTSIFDYFSEQIHHESQLSIKSLKKAALKYCIHINEAKGDPLLIPQSCLDSWITNRIGRTVGVDYCSYSNDNLPLLINFLISQTTSARWISVMDYLMSLLQVKFLSNKEKNIIVHSAYHLFLERQWTLTEDERPYWKTLVLQLMSHFRSSQLSRADEAIVTIRHFLIEIMKFSIKQKDFEIKEVLTFWIGLVFKVIHRESLVDPKILLPIITQKKGLEDSFDEESEVLDKDFDLKSDTLGRHNLPSQAHSSSVLLILDVYIPLLNEYGQGPLRNIKPALASHWLGKSFLILSAVHSVYNSLPEIMLKNIDLLIAILANFGFLNDIEVKDRYMLELYISQIHSFLQSHWNSIINASSVLSSSSAGAAQLFGLGVSIEFLGRIGKLLLHLALMPCYQRDDANMQKIEFYSWELLEVSKKLDIKNMRSVISFQVIMSISVIFAKFYMAFLKETNGQSKFAVPFYDRFFTKHSSFWMALWLRVAQFFISIYEYQKMESLQKMNLLDLPNSLEFFLEDEQLFESLFSMAPYLIRAIAEYIKMDRTNLMNVEFPTVQLIGFCTTSILYEPRDSPLRLSSVQLLTILLDLDHCDISNFFPSLAQLYDVTQALVESI